MQHPIFRKRSQKYFPEYEEEQSDTYESNLLKTIRIPKNIMHLSSRLPRKNYDSLDPRSNFMTMDPTKRFKANFLQKEMSVQDVSNNAALAS